MKHPENKNELPSGRAKKLLTKAGFIRVETVSLTGGIVTLYRAERE